MIGTEHRHMAGTAGTTGTAGQSVGQLVKQASEQLSDLVRQEMRLAQAELAAKGKRAGTGGGMLGAAALFAFIALERWPPPRSPPSPSYCPSGPPP